MKRNVLVVAGLALMSTSAFASKARIESFGNNANLYIKDTRNVFRNAATVNSNTNMIITEWGKSQSGDSVAAPRAEGGFFKEAGALNYGLYLGNNSTDGRDAAASGYLAQDNALDLFIGGDAGMQWGARLHYANSKNELVTNEERKNTAYGVGLGMVMGQAEAYANVTIADKSEGTVTGIAPATPTGTYANTKLETKPSFEVGGSYDLNGNILFAKVEMNKAEEGTTTFKENRYLVGAGRVMELTPTARVFGNAAVQYSKDEKATEDKSLTLPVAFGFETDATSWLTLRGSIGQNIGLNSTETKNTNTGVTTKGTEANTTNVTAGASLTFGKLAVDGYMGTQATGKLDANNLFSRVGVVYNF